VLARVLRTTVALMLAAPLLVATTPASGVSAAREASGTPGMRAVAVTLEAIEPRILTPTGTFTVRGSIMSPSPLQELHVAIWPGPALGSRDELHAVRDGVADGSQQAPLLRRVEVVSETVAGGRRASPGRSVSYAARVRVSDLHLTPDQVSVVSVVVSGRANGQATGQVAQGAQAPVGRVSTFVPYFPDTIGAPPLTNLIVPVTADPGLEQPGEPLAALSAATRSRPDGSHSRPGAVTLAVDPALAERSASLHRLSVAATTQGVTLTALPYADADLDALAAAGQLRAVAQRRQSSAARLGGLLGVPVDLGPVLPPGGIMTQAAFEASGASNIVVDGAAFGTPTALTSTPGGTATGTPTALTRIGRATALVTDPELQRLIGLADQGAATPRMAEQLVLAETALLAAEAPNATPSRALVLLTPRDWAASPTWAGQLSADLAAAPWLQPAPLDQLFAGTPVPRQGALPEHDDAALSDTAIQRDVSLRQGAATVGSLFSDPALTHSLERTLDRAESAGWRKHPDGAEVLRAAVQAQVTTAISGVTVSAAPGGVLLTGRNGSLPVTITNALRRQVTIVLSLTAGIGSRIDPVNQVLTIPAAGDTGPVRTQRSLRIVSRGAGRFPVSLQARTSSGAELSHPQTLTVRSSNLGGIAVGITVGALAVLILALTFRGTRGLLRWRRARRPDASAPAAPLAVTHGT
jgi:hypothetical protein